MLITKSQNILFWFFGLSKVAFILQNYPLRALALQIFVAHFDPKSQLLSMVRSESKNLGSNFQFGRRVLRSEWYPARFPAPLSRIRQLWNRWGDQFKWKRRIFIEFRRYWLFEWPHSDLGFGHFGWVFFINAVKKGFLLSLLGRKCNFLYS